MTTIGRLQADIAARLQRAGIETARLDAKILLGRALGVDALWLFNHANDIVTEDMSAAAEALVQRREKREPVSHILGQREFWSLTFAVTEETLAPRPDSETMITTMLDAIADRAAPLRLLDLGTGTGCLLLTLLSEFPNATGIGVDCHAGTLAVAERNAQTLMLDGRAHFLQSDWCAAVVGQFDAIISNPPYIPSQDILSLAPEVTEFEPRRALDGGSDGLEPYRVIAGQVAPLLRKGGLLAFEFGKGQAENVAGIVREAGFAIREIRRDLAGVERVLLAVN